MTDLATRASLACACLHLSALVCTRLHSSAPHSRLGTLDFISAFPYFAFLALGPTTVPSTPSTKRNGLSACIRSRIGFHPSRLFWASRPYTIDPTPDGAKYLLWSGVKLGSLTGRPRRTCVPLPAESSIFLSSAASGASTSTTTFHRISLGAYALTTDQSFGYLPKVRIRARSLVLSVIASPNQHPSRASPAQLPSLQRAQTTTSRSSTCLM
ncbi:hypothetical protein GGR54DRAFT_556602 [Hypoxylon sp. NC1633]|nr:hypothetical protein GGR54DRAFT_556602 [Hypoxylon sp. NC1633]